MSRDILRYYFLLLGGICGEIVNIFKPMFPLAFVAVCFILYDAYSAYELKRRIYKSYPKYVKTEGKFTSRDFSKVLQHTIPERLFVIVLAYLAERYVYKLSWMSLSHVVTGAIIFEQAWSILENKTSFRQERDTKFWKILKLYLLDKTERHLDTDVKEIMKEVDKKDKK